MKLFPRVLLVFLLLTTVVAADAVIVEFSAEPSLNKITLTWRTGDEINVASFVVERSLNNTNFEKIGELLAQGSNSEYMYEDTNVAASLDTYYYRLKIVNRDGSFQYTDSITVIPRISGFAKTWGSIKALFQ